VISDLIGTVADQANGMLVDDAKRTVDDLVSLLAGPERAPIDVERERAQFVRGVDLSTPTGGSPAVPVRPSDAGRGEAAQPSLLNLARPIEFIHFGRVHRDAARTFHADAPTDDRRPLPVGATPGRGVYFRAALEREAMLLGGTADCVRLALTASDVGEGELGDLMKLAADLVGGPGGTAGSAAPVDMNPFVQKVRTAWDAMNKVDVTYAELHDAGIKLHEVRANLTRYLLEQLSKEPPPPGANPGMLSNLPMIGEIPIPGPIGEVVATFNKVGGKIYDVQNAMIFGLTVAMMPAIEQACHTLSLDTIREERSPIFRTWYAPPPADPTRAPFADVGRDDVPNLALGSYEAADLISQERFDDLNSEINSAVAEPMRIIEFLSKEVQPAPGLRYLDLAFQAGTGTGEILGGSERLAEVALRAFYSALTDEIPPFMTGFVEDFISYVFAVSVEFLRSVYRVLVGLGPGARIVDEELRAAGSAHILTHLIDFATSKLGLDELLANLTLQIPPAPVNLPGINWPEDTLSAAPIVAELKRLLVDRVAPYLEPIVGYAMSGLASRLLRVRMWATLPAMTMEAHLAQLPMELALLFRNLFGPLWDFVTDTLMGFIGEAIGKALGPVAEKVGVVGDALKTASDAIADAQRKAQQAQQYVANVENAAGRLLDELSSVNASLTDVGDLSDIANAGQNLVGAATTNPFTPGGAGTGGDSMAPQFPSNRAVEGRGVRITPEELAAVAPNLKWETARTAPRVSAQSAAAASALAPAASALAAPTTPMAADGGAP
jgi:hypothetical protein